jgi:hypothetical protein
VLSSLGTLEAERCSFFQQSKDAAVGGPASDGVQPITEGLAINYVCGGGTKRRTTEGDEEAIPGLPRAAAEEARAMIADVFKLRALRITRFFKQFKLSETPDRDSRFPKPVSHVIFHLLFAGQLQAFLLCRSIRPARIGNSEKFKSFPRKISGIFRAHDESWKSRGREIRTERIHAWIRETLQGDFRWGSRDWLASACKGPGLPGREAS